MAKLKSKSRAFFQSARLTPEEFAFLKEVGSELCSVLFRTSLGIA